MKILNSEWRSARDTVGIVLIENDMGKQSARIGVARSPDEFVDAVLIAQNGAKLSFREAQAFFPFIKKEDYKYE